MERDYGQVPLYLEGETVYVIGGGPSLIDFDFKILKEENTIGANDAGRLSDADVIVTLDRNYHKNRTKDLVAAAKKGKAVYSALPADATGYEFPKEIVNLRFKRGKGLSQNPGMIYGLNSGFAALNVAYLAGAKDIRLLGFDFRFPPEQPHWHEEHPWFKQKSDRQLRKWARDFDLTQLQLEAHEVKVTNYVGPAGSEIDTYDKRPLSELTP